MYSGDWVCHKISQCVKVDHKQDLFLALKFYFPFRIYKSLANADSKQQQLLDWDNTDRDKGKPSVQILS